MARARLLKPGFFRNEVLAQLPMAARLLFAGLWTLADREGRLEDRPLRIKADLFPWDAVDVDPLLDDLQRHGFIIRYQADGVRCIAVAKFHDHQAPHLREAPSRLPAQDQPRASLGLAPALAVPGTVLAPALAVRHVNEGGTSPASDDCLATIHSDLGGTSPAVPITVPVPVPITETETDRGAARDERPLAPMASALVARLEAARASSGRQFGRLFLHRWQVDALIATLGEHVTGFDLDVWLDDLARRPGVLPKDRWAWVQAELHAEVQRRGLAVAETTPAAPTNKRIVGLVKGGEAFLAQLAREGGGEGA